ncbi:MAG: hypothetical protein HQK57_11120 [Deltaproteobacteria bacterium]|nr:hypothetical protein [Deltaproteobacteria bacterium]
MTKFPDRRNGAKKSYSLVSSLSMLLAVEATGKDAAKRAGGISAIAVSEFCGRFYRAKWERGSL